MKGALKATSNWPKMPVSWPLWPERSFLTWSPRCPGWRTVDSQKSNAKMLCVHFPEKEPMAFIRFSKGYLTPKILWPTVLIRKGAMLSMILSLNIHWKIIWSCNEMVAHNSQGRGKGRVRASVSRSWGLEPGSSWVDRGPSHFSEVAWGSGPQVAPSATALAIYPFTSKNGCLGLRKHGREALGIRGDGADPLSTLCPFC